MVGDVPELAPVLFELRPVGYHHEQRKVPSTLHESVEHLKGGGVDPVHVLHQNQQGAVAGGLLHPLYQ